MWKKVIGDNGTQEMELQARKERCSGPTLGFYPHWLPTADLIGRYNKEALKMFTCTSCTREHDATNHAMILSCLLFIHSLL